MFGVVYGIADLHLMHGVNRTLNAPLAHTGGGMLRSDRTGGITFV